MHLFGKHRTKAYFFCTLQLIILNISNIVVNGLYLNPPTESHYAQFHAALLNKEPKHLDILLCYEQSRACVGVKHTSFQVGHGYVMKNIHMNVHLILN